MSTWAWKIDEQCYGYCEWYCYNIILHDYWSIDIELYSSLSFTIGLSPIDIPVKIIASGGMVLGQSS